MPNVRVPGVGVVAFPDTMSAEEIRQAIRRKTGVTQRDEALQAVGAPPPSLPSPRSPIPPPPDPSIGLLENFAGGVWSQVDPVAAVKAGVETMAHPIAAGRDILQAQGALGQRSAEAFRQGDVGQGVLSGVNYMLPVVGPAIQQIQDRLASGDTAYGVGQSIGLPLALAAPVAVPRGVRAGTAALSRTAPAQQVAGGLERAAERKLTDVMVPKVGANKVRFGNDAARVAPKLLKDPDLSAWSREGLQGKIEAKFAEAEAALDLAHNQNPALAAKVFNVPQIVRELKKVRQRFVAETARAKGIPKAGQDVVPAPNTSIVSTINQVIAELETLAGDAGLARYEGVRRIRESWDKPARAKYHPSTTQDYMAKQGEATGAAASTGALREWLAKFSPETAQANEAYSVFKSARDVMRATEEVERVRPSRRRAFEASVGAVGGYMHSGVPGAVMGGILGPAVDMAATSSYTTQVAIGRLLDQLATAIRTGNQAQQQSLVAKLARMTGQAVPLNITQPARTPRVMLPTPTTASVDDQNP